MPGRENYYGVMHGVISDCPEFSGVRFMTPEDAVKENLEGRKVIDRTLCYTDEVEKSLTLKV
ncbi:hypothetical protein GF389_01330 [Candidatus Dojkabacteria bacterium]|nr:hypothetical protein [Candidatus Dojkabacteria bacterium]